VVMLVILELRKRFMIPGYRDDDIESWNTFMLDSVCEFPDFDSVWLGGMDLVIASAGFVSPSIQRNSAYLPSFIRLA
jgi:hypothetical protein